MSAQLTLDRVTKSFDDGGSPALDGVTLDVPAGSCTAILGPSGSGKSTILRVMAGLDFASAGQVLLDGVDLAGVAPERRGMGMVFQRPLLFPHLSVLDNVAFADRVSGVPTRTARANAERYLDMVQLAGFGGRGVHELSGGQEQRVAIARALAAQPAVLLLDEPFSALDPALRGDMHALVDEIRSALAPTIVIVTHDRDEASAVADRIAMLHAGELLQHDTVERVYNRPASLRVARLMGGTNEIPGEVVGDTHYSAFGSVDLADPVAPGPGTLVVRQEAVGVRRTDAAAPAAAPTAAGEIAGVVAAIKRLGPRQTLAIELGSSGVRLNAELPPGQGVRVGSSVAVHLPAAAVSVVRD